jgi:hypothetical protein
VKRNTRHKSSQTHADLSPVMLTLNLIRRSFPFEFVVKCYADKVRHM